MYSKFCCCQVSSFWDQLVKEEVWGSPLGRRGLTEKLKQRWLSLVPGIDRLGEVKDVESIFCDDKHIFCGLRIGLVQVFNITSGELIRHLRPKEPVQTSGWGASDTLVSGGKKMVVAVTWERFVTIWSTEGDMECLNSYESMCDECRENPFYCWECDISLTHPVCSGCSCNDEKTLEKGVCNVSVYDVKVTPSGNVVFLASFFDAYSSMFIMKKSEGSWNVTETPIDERCEPLQLGTLQLGCLGNPFILCKDRGQESYYLCFGSAENNFEDWSHHPHTDEGFEGFELDENITSGICALFVEPPFIILVNENPDYEEESVAMRVYQMSTYKELKAFGYRRGRCENLVTNKYVVVQLQSTTPDESNYILIYDRETLLDPWMSAEDVKIQRIEINHEQLMSINTTSLVFAARERRGSNVDLKVLNFWLERDPVGFQDGLGEDEQKSRGEDENKQVAEDGVVSCGMA